MTTIAVAAAVAALITSAPLRAADENAPGRDQNGQLTRKDYKFAREAAQGGLLELKMGELAKQKGAHPTVQQFGERMVTDHSKANEQLQKLATQKGAALPIELTPREESQLEHLQKLSGHDFDKAYAERMVKDHKKDIKEFQDAAKTAEDADLKNFAAATLPILQEHQKMAEQMESSVKQVEP